MEHVKPDPGVSPTGRIAVIWTKQNKTLFCLGENCCVEPARFQAVEAAAESPKPRTFGYLEIFLLLRLGSLPCADWLVALNVSLTVTSPQLYSTPGPLTIIHVGLCPYNLYPLLFFLVLSSFHKKYNLLPPEKQKKNTQSKNYSKN